VTELRQAEHGIVSDCCRYSWHFRNPTAVPHVVVEDESQIPHQEDRRIFSAPTRDSGTGKSHPLIGLGMKAFEMGKCRCVTCAQLVNELAEAAQQSASRASSPLLTSRPVVARRTGLRATRNPRGGVDVPDSHPTRGALLGRDRHQPAVLGVGHDRPRCTTGSGDHRPTHLSRAHHRNRFDCYRLRPRSHAHSLVTTLNLTVDVKELKRSGLNRSPCQATMSTLFLITRVWP